MILEKLPIVNKAGDSLLNSERAQVRKQNLQARTEIPLRITT